MRRGLLSILVFLLVGSSSLLAKERTASLTGWVSDEHCGATHTKPGGADCVRKCIKGGADVGPPEGKPQRMVLVTEGDNKIYIVANPILLQGLEGERVRVTGQLDADAKSIRVTTAVAQRNEEAKK